MERFNEEVIANLLRRGYEIENYEGQIVLKLFMAEEYGERRKVFYRLLKDCEFHRHLLKTAIKHLKCKVPTETAIKDPMFEEMFIKEKLNFLRRVEEISMDFYSFLLEDLKKQKLENLLGEKETEELIKIVEGLVKDEKAHLKLIEKMWKME